jgi:hypothetical protein
MAGTGRLRAQWNEALLQLVVAPAYLELLIAAAAALGPGPQFNRCGTFLASVCGRHAGHVAIGTSHAELRSQQECLCQPSPRAMLWQLSAPSGALCSAVLPILRILTVGDDACGAVQVVAIM